jgi:hypothetical protein
MNSQTYKKIQDKATYLRFIHSKGKLENLELFDEPYKLALNILDCSHLEPDMCAVYLGINPETVKQVRSALGVN